MYLVNFADEKFAAAQNLNSKTAVEIANFANVFEYKKNDIDSNFLQKHEKILSQSKGAGYWLWKPYIILDALKKIKHNEILFYSDSAAYFTRDARVLASLPNRNAQDIIPFELIYPEGMYTKRDAFSLMALDNFGFETTNQRLASFILIKKSDFSFKFVEEYLHWCCNPQILTDVENICGLENFVNFIDHRHDQSIFSLLTKKYKLTAFRDPSQWGNSQYHFSNSDYPQLIEHTRDKTAKSIKFTHKLKFKINNLLKKF